MLAGHLLLLLLLLRSSTSRLLLVVLLAHRPGYHGHLPPQLVLLPPLHPQGLWVLV